MSDRGRIQDMETRVVDNYMEYTRVRGSVDISEITDKYALWQAVCGEIKTKIGECQGVGMENYGCDIWKILGQNLTPLVVDQAKLYIEELAPKYEEINDIEVVDIVIRKDGKLLLTVYVDSNLGTVQGDVIVC